MTTLTTEETGTAQATGAEKPKPGKKARVAAKRAPVAAKKVKSTSKAKAAKAAPKAKAPKKAPKAVRKAGAANEECRVGRLPRALLTVHASRLVKGKAVLFRISVAL